MDVMTTWLLWVSFLVLLLLTTDGAWSQHVASSTEETTMAEYCEGETFEAKCQNDQVILMQAARYGRMRIGKCLTGEGGVMECSTDALHLFDLWCSGQHECHVRVSSIIDSIPDGEQPCSKDFRSYLEASYTCVKVVRKPQDSCIASNRAEINAPSGYLASVITDETSCGSFDIPWVLRMGEGQTMDIQLYDFAVASRDSSSIPDVCHVYAIIKEKGGLSTETICSSMERENVVYRSTTNYLEIRLVTNRKKEGYFMLKYNTKGCPDPAAPPYGWVERQGDEALMGCNMTSDVWSMKCDGHGWTGNGINCTKIPGAAGRPGQPIIGLFTGTQWASIVIILAIAVTLGLIIFLVGLVFLRRKRTLQERRTNATRDRPIVSDMYSTQYRDSVSTPYGTKPLASMDCSSSENDYYRTWQLQRHPPGGRLVPGAGAHGSLPSTGNDPSNEQAHHMMVCTNPRCAQRPYDTMDADKRYPMEHIYESPKFDRREINVPPPPQNQTSTSTTGSSTQYFELDPEQV